MNNPTQIKLYPTGKAFLEKLRVNRVKADIDKKTIGYAKLIEVIYQYFKENNDRYKELLKLEYKKNV